MKLILITVVAIITLSSCFESYECMGFTGMGPDITKRDTLRLDPANSYYIPRLDRMEFTGTNEITFSKQDDSLKFQMEVVSSETKSTECGEERSKIWCTNQVDYVSYNSSSYSVRELIISRTKQNKGLFTYDFNKAKAWKEVVAVKIDFETFIIPLYAMPDTLSYFYRSYTINGVAYDSVYQCSHSPSFNRISVTSVYYNTRKGLLAFAYSNGAYYVRK